MRTKLFQLRALSGIIFVAIAAASAPGAVAQVAIPVTFDANGCPVAGSVPDVSAARGERLTWQAYDQAGAVSQEAFRVYFDPIQGATLRAGNGTVSRPVDSNAPRVDYKYTVVGDRCPNSPLDPNIRVN